jgi:allantoinase
VQIQDACLWLEGEAASHGGRMLPLNITPYIMGLPYRIDAFEGLLGWLKNRADVAFATGADLLP